MRKIVNSTDIRTIIISRGKFMNILKRYLLLFSLVYLPTAEANMGLYIGGETGFTKNFGNIFNFIDDTDLGDDGPDLEYVEDQTMKSIVVGYGFNVFHLEAVMADLGDTGFEYGEYLEYERKTKIIALAARWKWRWFSFRVGVGRALIDATADDTTSGTQTVGHDLDEGSNGYMAFLFSYGVNFPIAESFNLYIESIGYSWAQDDGTLEYDDGAGSTGSETIGDTQSVQSLAIGARFYL